MTFVLALDISRPTSTLVTTKAPTTFVVAALGKDFARWWEWQLPSDRYGVDILVPRFANNGHPNRDRSKFSFWLIWVMIESSSPVRFNSANNVVARVIIANVGSRVEIDFRNDPNSFDLHTSLTRRPPKRLVLSHDWKRQFFARR